MFRKQVKCCSCGFLALHESLPSIPVYLKTIQDFKAARELGFYSSRECTQRGRDHVADGTHSAPSTLTCTRNVWSYSDFKDRPKEAIFEVLNSKRKCPFFFKYSPSYSPAEHRELQRESKTQNLLIVGMLLAALIGAAAAIVAQFIAH